ncbi:MAG: tetratricopeptide repeat protein [Lewinellaceae bacterium]|nr:tetratricopeptide repeat protein [Lewinellaceae bacterium]
MMFRRPGMLHSILPLFFGLAFLVFVAGLLQQCSPGPVPLEKQYIGTQACASCHEPEMMSWQGSHHDRAMQEATDETVLGNFEQARFESHGVISTFFKRDGKFFVNTEGPDSLLHDYEIKYTFGFTPLQQYMVEMARGKIQCLLIAWDDIGKKWFDLQPSARFAPDDWMHWTGGSMTWNTMCADCHSTYLQKNYFEEPDSFATRWAAIDVSCEACHGPGLEHQKYVKSPAYKKGETVKGSFLHLTADLSSKEQVDQCARCHSRRSQYSKAYDHSGVFMDHYLPEILRPGLYYPDGQILDEVYVYGSFLQSRMYRNNVRCSDCHDAHSLKLKFDGNDLCLQCHDKEKYDTASHHFHDPAGEGASCVGCHMPGRTYMGNDYRRDHSFRVPRPDLSVRFGSPNSCNECHDDKTAAWAAKTVVDWYGPVRQPHFADVLAPVLVGERAAGPELRSMLGDTSKPEIVQATAIWLIGSAGDEASRRTIIEGLKHPNPLVRFMAVDAMEHFPLEERARFLSPLLKDPVLTVRTQAAYVLAGPGAQLLQGVQKQDFERADQEFRDVLAMQADFPGGQLLKGQYYYKKKDLARTEQAFREAIRRDPYLSPAYFNLAQLYYQQGKLDDAVREFRNVIRVQPDHATAWYSLGLLLAEMNDLQQAKTCLAKAADLEENPRYYYNLGLVYQKLEQNALAEATFLKALSIDPASEANLYALAILYLQQGQLNKARGMVEKLLEISPDNNAYRQLLLQVR